MYVGTVTHYSMWWYVMVLANGGIHCEVPSAGYALRRLHSMLTMCHTLSTTTSRTQQLTEHLLTWHNVCELRVEGIAICRV